MAACETPAVYIVSDSLGETADQVAKAALSQFEADRFNVIRMPKISSPSQIEGIVQAAAHDECVIFLYTFADPQLRDEMSRAARETHVTAVDILGPQKQRIAVAISTSAVLDKLERPDTQTGEVPHDARDLARIAGHHHALDSGPDACCDKVPYRLINHTAVKGNAQQFMVELVVKAVDAELYRSEQVG